MQDMLAAYHLSRYFDLRRREMEPYRECVNPPKVSLGQRIRLVFRKKAA
jgi:hypothetical protein